MSRKLPVKGIKSSCAQQEDFPISGGLLGNTLRKHSRYRGVYIAHEIEKSATGLAFRLPQV